MKRVMMVVLIGLAVFGVVFAGRGPEDMSREEKNKLLVKVAIGAMNAGDWVTLSEVYSPKFIQHSPGRSKPLTWEDLEFGCRVIRKKIPTLRCEIEDIIAEGNKVAVRLRTVITYKETTYPGTRGADKVEVTEIDIMRIEGGRIVEEWCESDKKDWERKFEKLQYIKTWR